MSIPTKKYKSNEIFVNRKSNFKSQLVKCQKIMDDIKFDQLVIHGLGKAIDRSINLAQELNSNNFNTFEVKRKDVIVNIKEDKRKKIIHKMDYDEFDPDDMEVANKKVVSEVPAVEIIVRKNKLELDKLKEMRKKDPFQTTVR